MWDPALDRDYAHGGHTTTAASGPLDETTWSLNDLGQIAYAKGFNIYRADPLEEGVPEPGTLALLLSGIAGLVLWQRRRQGRR